MADIPIREMEDNIDGSSKRLEPYPDYLKAELGLRNHWYAALFGHELEEGKCKGEMIMGERILFKRVDGKVYGIADRCPHRGAAFSARPECYTKNTVTCWFHGFTIDVRDGNLVQVITDPDSRLIGRLKHKTYPVQEINGVIFVFMGDMDPPPPIEQDLQPKFLRPKLAFHPVARNKFRANWRIAAETVSTPPTCTPTARPAYSISPMPACPFPASRKRRIPWRSSTTTRAPGASSRWMTTLSGRRRSRARP